MVCAKLPLWAGVAPLGGCLSAGGHAAGSALAAAGRNGGVSVCGVSTAGGIRVTNEALGDDLRCPVSLHLGAQHPGAPRASCRWLKHAAQGWCGAAIVPAGTGSRRWLLGWHRGTSRTQLQHPPPPCPRLVVHCTQGAVWLLDQLANPGPPHPRAPPAMARQSGAGTIGATEVLCWNPVKCGKRCQIFHCRALESVSGASLPRGRAIYSSPCCKRARRISCYDLHSKWRGHGRAVRAAPGWDCSCSRNPSITQMYIQSSVSHAYTHTLSLCTTVYLHQDCLHHKISLTRTLGTLSAARGELSCGASGINPSWALHVPKG